MDKCSEPIHRPAKPIHMVPLHSLDLAATERGWRHWSEEGNTQPDLVAVRAVPPEVEERGRHAQQGRQASRMRVMSHHLVSRWAAGPRAALLRRTTSRRREGKGRERREGKGREKEGREREGRVWLRVGMSS